MQSLIKKGTHFIFLFVLFGALAVSASALTFTVNSTANASDASAADNVCDVDTSTIGDQCTLRAAIEQANASAGMDTINFDATVFASAQEIFVSSTAYPQITGELTINGTSPALLIIDGTGNRRIFNIASGATVIINNLTVENGYAGEADGAGIYNAGNLTLNNVAVRFNEVSFGSGGGIYNEGTLVVNNSSIHGNNVAGFFGGGIASSGPLTITNSQIYENFVAGDFGGGLGGGISNEESTVNITGSTIRDNTGANGGGIFNVSGTLNLTSTNISTNTADGGDGGGIFTEGNSTVTVTRSTLNGNTAVNGGGIYNTGGGVSLDNSTLSGNSAGGNGGGYYGFADIESLTSSLTAAASTIAFNTAANGGGIAVTSAGGSSSANLSNTIVGNNSASSGEDIYSSSAVALSEKSIAAEKNAATNLGAITGVVSTGNNLIENTSGATYVPGLADITGVDPGLLPLGGNGGTTPTHALASNSPAIDKGNSTGTDQRGVARPIDNTNVPPATPGNNSDIGSYEASAGTTAASVNIGGRVVTSAGRGLGNARVVLTESNGTVRQTMTNSFGYYRFTNVSAGQTATLQVYSKRFGFLPQIVNIGEETNNLNFVAQP